MTIGDPTLFPFRHDWGEPFKVTREWRTDVETASDGSEVRVQLRANPNVSLQMRAIFPTGYGAGRLLAQWRSASQPLRYYAPLWCDATDLDTALVGGESSIACDTTDRPFFAADGFAMLYSETPQGVVTSELVIVDTLTSTTGFTITGAVANAYDAGAATRVVPCRIMWLTLPVTVTWLSPQIATVDLQFTDERDQAGYTLAAGDTTATPASLRIYADAQGRTGEGQIGWVAYEAFFEAVVEDALGIPIPFVSVEWTSTDNEPPYTGITITPSMNSRFARVYVATASGNITATVGSVSHTIGVN